MPRSRKKGYFVPAHLAKKIIAAQTSGSKKPIRTYARNSHITEEMIGAPPIDVHNGRSFQRVHIVDTMVGHKLGEFAPTRTFRGHRATEKKSVRR